MMLLSVAFAGPLDDALAAELERNQTLELPDAPPIYHLRYHLADLDQRGAVASFGSMLRAREDPYHALGVELRVGTPAFDNTGFGGWEDGFLRTNLPRELTPITLREGAWSLTDAAYKQAVEQHARKTSQFSPPKDYPGDYTPMTGSTHQVDAPLLGPVYSELVQELSDIFTPAGGDLLRGEVYLGQEAGSITMVDTEGANLRLPVQELTLRAVASARTDDGVLLTDSRLWSAQHTLPDAATLEAEVTAMRDSLVSRTKTVRLEDEYVGPLIFEQDAAVDLVRYLLVDQLEGTPPPVPFDSLFGDLGEDKASVRVGRRVLPEGWTAIDDPRTDPTHPSSFTHDWEGTVAQHTSLVQDGIVRDLLMSRVPRKDLKPNGHARGFLGERSSGRVAQLTVTPPKTRSTAWLRKRALKMAASYGRDHVFVVRRLQEPSALVLHGRAAARGIDRTGALPPPVELIKVYSDGREERVHGARFAFSDRFMLRDIAFAGPQRSTTFLAPFRGSYYYLDPTQGLPTWVSAPDVLVREVELAPVGADPRDTPVLTP